MPNLLLRRLDLLEDVEMLEDIELLEDIVLLEDLGHMLEVIWAGGTTP